MKILDKSVQLSRELFPLAYSGKTRYRQFHFAFAFHRNKLLAIGQNTYGKEMAKAIKFSTKLGSVEKFREGQLHAEVDVISRLWGRTYIDSRLRLVVIRINSRGELCNSRPCNNCMTVIESLGINKIWFSTENQEVERL